MGSVFRNFFLKFNQHGTLNLKFYLFQLAFVFERSVQDHFHSASQLGQHRVRERRGEQTKKRLKAAQPQGTTKTKLPERESNQTVD